MIISISIAVVRTWELDARIVPLNTISEIIIIIVVVGCGGGCGGGGGDVGGGGVLYFASYWLKRELLCVNNFANFFSI